MLLVYLLRHDDAESITGDIPGPVKRLCKLDLSKAKAVSMDRFKWDCSDESCFEEMKQIRVVADLMDELFFLSGERGMGNQFVQSSLQNVRDRITLEIEKLPNSKLSQRTAIRAAIGDLAMREQDGMKNLEGLRGV